MLRKSFLALDVSLSMRAQLQQTAWLLHTCTVWRRAKQSTGEASTQKYSPNKLQRLLYKEYLRTSIDPAKEEINLEVRDNVTVDRLAQRVPRDHFLYQLFLFPHKHQGEKFKSINKD
ncbi:uncharacterized protein LOC142592718 isoform X2 [Dermacentor variabilis]|uniref:uncharacterized protein LOC142592718 isoform X2 n=1 Tax=Dermacentor variabilis TaxID=34621 RepID=UPI003F5B25E9